MTDPYKVLGVDRNASADDVKRAYRKLAKQLHPDLNPGDTKVEQQFKEVSLAYTIRGDPEKRKRFDRGEIDASGQETGWRGGFYRNYAEGSGGSKYSTHEFRFDHGLDDIFSEFFGGRRERGGARHNVRRRGADVSYEITVGFLEATKGAKKRLALADGKTLDVTIPAGTEDQQTLRLKGQGLPGLGGAPAGDAFIKVTIEPDRIFTREGLDVHLEVPISLHEAISGGSVQVPTIQGKVSMKIPPGANSGTTLRLKGKGITDRKSGEQGDQFVKLKVMLPDDLDQEFKDFIETWYKKRPYDPRSKSGMGSG